MPVVSHALDIPARLKELDEGYFILFNTKTQKFEIWHRGDGEGVLECVLPYEELDARAIRHVREHRVERMESLIREIEAHNAKLEEQKKRKWLAEAGERTKEAISYLRNRSDVDEIPAELMKKGEGR